MITPLELKLSSLHYSAVESTGRVCINVTADGPASEPFVVYLVPMGMWGYRSASCELILLIVIYIVFGICIRGMLEPNVNYTYMYIGVLSLKSFKPRLS